MIVRFVFFHENDFKKLVIVHNYRKDLLSISMVTFCTLSSGAPKTERKYMIKMVDKINVSFVGE